MATSSVTIIEDSTPQLKAKLEKIKKTHPLFKKIGAYMSSSTQRKIKEKNFKNNSPLTYKLKGNDKPLRDKGHLLASIASESDDTSAIVGTNRPFAEVHQKGKTIRARLAKKLAIPATKAMKKLVEQHGTVRKVLRFLQTTRGGGWKIFFHEKAILGSRKRQSGGLHLVSESSAIGRRSRSSRAKKEVEIFFIRKESIVIPQRRFLYNDDIDDKVIMEMALNFVKDA